MLDRVIGKHYVFCGNGHSGNPDVDVVELMVKHRLKAPGKFKFWFNSSEAVADAGNIERVTWRRCRRPRNRLAKNSGGRMTFKFLEIRQQPPRGVGGACRRILSTDKRFRFAATRSRGYNRRRVAD